MTLSDGQPGQHLCILENPNSRSQEMGFVIGTIVSVFKKKLFLPENQFNLIALRQDDANQIIVEIVAGDGFNISE